MKKNVVKGFAATAIMTMAMSTMLCVPVLASSGQGDLIGEDKAREIALEDAGLKEKEITLIKSEYEMDDGREQYDVEFLKGNQEYDYDIDANTGEIISRDQEIEDDFIVTKKSIKAVAGKSAKKGEISKEEALRIAREHAGVSEKDISYSKVEADYDDGVPVYDVEFHVGRKEYSCDVNRKTGAVTDFETEIDD